MSRSIPPFTLGYAFAHNRWITLGIDGVALVLSCISCFAFGTWVGLLSAVCGWALAFLFSEGNSFIAQLLDLGRLKGAQYLAGMVMLWMAKIILALIAGTLIATFAPINVTMFCIVLMVCVSVIVLKNAIIAAHARVL